MKQNFKNIIFSVGVIIFTLTLSGFVLVNKVEAATCVATATGNWDGVAGAGGSGTATFTGCTGAVAFPEVTDTVTINSGVVLTISGSATVAGVMINDPVASSNGITISGSNTLTTGAITISASSDVGTATIVVGAGTLTPTSITINGGSSSGASFVSVNTGGTINVSGDISFNNVSNKAQLIFLGAGTLNIQGNLGSGGNLKTVLPGPPNGNGTINFNGSGAQDIGAYITYNNVTINKSAGTATLLGTTTFLGTLTLTAGTFATGTQTFTTTGASSITGTITTGASGTKTFTGNVTLNSGAVWTGGGAPVTFGGSLTNNATWTASTGVHTFSGATQTISGTTATVVPNLTIGGTVTNNGTLTVSTALAGAGTLTNGATGTLNIGDDLVDISALTANTDGNTVNYNKSGAQDVNITAVYYNLGLSGGVKTILGTIPALVIGGNLTIASDATANLNGLPSANALYLGGDKKIAGTWGAAGTGATNINDTYFSGPGTLTVLVGIVPTGTSAVVTNSTATTVDVVVTGTNFATFVNSGTTTANATDRAGITYRSTNPTSAIINNATTMTLTFAIAMGTDTSGSLTIAANIVQDSGSPTTPNTLITITSGSITDTANPVLNSVVLSNTGTRNRITFTYSEPVTVSNGASTTSSGDTTTAGTVAGFGSFATTGNVVVGTTKNTIAGNGTAIITLDLADQTGGFMTTGSTTEPSGVFTSVASSAVVDASSNQAFIATPTASGTGTWDLTKPTITSITVSDATGSNSKIDRAVIVFDSAVRDSSITNADATLGTSGTITGSFTTGTANDDTTTFNRTTDDNVVDTTTAAGDFAYSGSTTKITDLAGNLLNTATDGTIVTADVTETDGVAPTVTVTMNDSALTVGETATVTFTFSEAPTGFTSADVTVANGTIGAIDATTPTAQTATYTPTAEISDTTNVISVGTGWTDTAGNTGVGDDSPNYTVDTVTPSTSSSGSVARPPTNNFISINTNAITTTSTSVNLNLSSTGATQMMISNDPLFTGAVWETYVTIKPWTLTTGDGVKTVYVKFKKNYGNASTVVSDTITLITPIILPTLNPIQDQAQLAGIVKFTTFIRKTSPKADVKNLQKALNILVGSSLPKLLVIDGLLGPKSIAGVKAFQKVNPPLVVDGKAGPMTNAVLNLLLGV